MKKLIICEKPNLARTVSKSIRLLNENPIQKHGYFESENYLITYAFGHLFTLCDIDDYKGIKDKWDLNELPFIPDGFRFCLKKDFKTKKTDDGVKKQFELIKKLIHQSEVSSIIHCGDSDREGEIIIRIILEEAGNTKYIERLWVNDQTESSLAKGIKSLIDDRKFDLLAEEGMARTYVDWLYGINLTRYVTLMAGTLMKVGRVKSAITKAIYDREMAINNFIVTEYYGIETVFNVNEFSFKLNSKNKFNKDEYDDGNELLSKYNNSMIEVKNILKNSKIIKSPKLFSQTSLQNEMSDRFSFTPQQTLSTSQKLYEMGYITYPRTNTEYLSSSEIHKISEILNSINEKNEYQFILKNDKSIFDDSKIESHSAIIPTGKDFIEVENEDLVNCYNTIMKRFMSVFCKEEYIVDETIVQLECCNEIFEIKGSITKKYGWNRFANDEANDKLLPELKVGDKFQCIFDLVEKQTIPKKHFTVKTLNNYLKNPFREELDTDDRNDCEDYKNLLEGSEIGTEATRAGIIEDCIKSELIRLKNKSYSITENGIHYIESLEKLSIDLNEKKTIEINKKLKEIYLGSKTINELVDSIKTELDEIILSDIKIEKIMHEKEILGICLKCGGNVVKGKSKEGKVSYYCENWKEENGSCSFRLYEDMKYFNNLLKLNDSKVKKLLEGKKVSFQLRSKNGKYYEAYLRLVVNGNYINFEHDGYVNK